MSAGGVRNGLDQSERDEHVSVMPPWAIWVGAVVVLLVGAASGWLLLSFFGGGSAQDKVRLEILKLTGSIVLGTGGGVALLLAARRQRATEVDLAQKKQAAADTRHDAEERRVTELYTSAAEQLGSDKAAVRLAGLYALERLAQENRKHRPTIVEVICAYLRMPYTPPLGEKSSARTGGRTLRLGLRPPNRSKMSPSPIRAVSLIASNFSDVAEPQEDRRQELQVRLAAQRLLLRHLRPEPDEQDQPTNPKFWPDVELDLTGAVLNDWDMSGCQVASAAFGRAEFHGFAGFHGATSHGFAQFANATFHHHAWFVGATFHERASFGSATFHKLAQFDLATFHRYASFKRATFHDQASFGGATFHDRAGFSEATVHSIAAFLDVTFHGPVIFLHALFHHCASFRHATFHNQASFGSATFHKFAQFDLATFHGEVNCTSVQAKADQDHKWPPGWVLRKHTDSPELTEQWGVLAPENGGDGVPDGTAN